MIYLLNMVISIVMLDYVNVSQRVTSPWFFLGHGCHGTLFSSSIDLDATRLAPFQLQQIVIHQQDAAERYTVLHG